MGLIIKVRITGGLGNQLFKFANGLRVSDYFKSDLVLDISWYSHNYMKSNFVSNREFELNYFPEITNFKQYVTKFPEIDKVRGKLERRLSPKIQERIGLMTEGNVDFFIKRPNVIDGSFERISFLANIEALEHCLKFPKQTSRWFDESLLHDSNKFAIAVHVRRTDYLNLGHIYDVVGKNYYLNSIQLLRQANQKIELHLFSDDPDGALRWFGKDLKFEKIINPPVGTPSGEVLRLMSTYKSIIAANSTFSWWAAFLGRMKNKELQVVLPKQFSNLPNDDPEKYLKIEGSVFL